MRFRIEPKYIAQNQTSYVTTSLGKPNSVNKAIMEEIANRPNPYDLEYLLVSPRTLDTLRDTNI